MSKYLWITLALLFIASPALATEASFQKNMARGIAALEANDYPAAIVEFREGLKEHPEDVEANLYLGIALSRVNDAECETVLKKALLLAPDNPRTNLELGIVYYNRKVVTEATDYFENTKKVAPGSDVALKADEFLQYLSGGNTEKRWTLKFLTGLQFDSNVLLNADGSPLPQGISRKSDWRGLLSGGIGYSLFKNDKAEVNAGYSLYQSLHTSLSDFNVTQNLLELGGEYKLSPMVSLKGNYSLEYLLLGGESYDLANTVAPAVVVTLAKGFATTLEYRFRSTTFYNSGMFATNNERNGVNHLVGISQKLPLSEKVTARIGYAHDEELTRSAFWDFSGDRGNAGVTWFLPHNTIVDLAGDITSRRYGAIFPTTALVRDDFIGTLSVSATLVFADHYGVTLGFFYDRNQSNIPAFDYVRTITSLMLSGRY